MDFLNLLEPDMSIKILTCLDDPSDLVRVGAVSRSWHYFVVANGLCKQLCLRMFPQLSSVVRISESSCCKKTPDDVGSSRALELETLEREHKVYALLAQGLTSLDVGGCIMDAVSASSTDNNPEESIDNTLEPRDRVGRSASYWSSEGQCDPAAPETLIYKLVASLCVIHEINIQPFQAYFQMGSPIYSAKAVRFRMGHCKTSVGQGTDNSGQASQGSADERFIWTYTSPEFPMVQENRLQNFKLPEPVLCIGGILQVELLGRVQRQDMDGLFYICVAHVQVIGRPLSPGFDIQILKPSGDFLLEYKPHEHNRHPPGFAGDEIKVIDAQPQALHGDTGLVLQLFDLLRGNVPLLVEEEEGDEEQDGSDEEYIE